MRNVVQKGLLLLMLMRGTVCFAAGSIEQSQLPVALDSQQLLNRWRIKTFQPMKEALAEIYSHLTMYRAKPGDESYVDFEELVGAEFPEEKHEICIAASWENEDAEKLVHEAIAKVVPEDLMITLVDLEAIKENRPGAYQTFIQALMDFFGAKIIPLCRSEAEKHTDSVMQKLLFYAAAAELLEVVSYAVKIKHMMLSDAGNDIETVIKIVRFWGDVKLSGEALMRSLIDILEPGVIVAQEQLDALENGLSAVQECPARKMRTMSRDRHVSFSSDVGAEKEYTDVLPVGAASEVHIELVAFTKKEHYSRQFPRDFLLEDLGAWNKARAKNHYLQEQLKK